ncbi:bacilysin biosynthesis protein BacA [Streptomyces sp. CJ_13]|uniref:bacilysin biosynthesis protein BacA n=1 Tax=Streptomyces TaxID=1883 RepID=UPI000F430E24|nr:MULTISPECIES: bacilysin biosynthesis protein BacA [unclassified Streptomyces]AYV32743.1 prephenate dehydratase [Streptomyces sp. ADI95-16]MBT1185801.1 bacilysin biosynthesis protein BacA [Streptomyces sp. CJ_13]
MEILQIPESERRVFDALIPAGSAKSVKLGTLGPKGTSSEYIAQSMVRSIGDRDALRIVLESTYEQCMTALADGQVDLALVAHAYPKINAFYMNPLLEPAIVFRGNTPEYGLATRPDFEFREELLFSETVVSHPAPVPLLEYHFGRPVRLATANSTSQAARDVADGRYDIAITNAQAVREHNLKFVYRFSHIPMTWTVFSRKVNK